MDHVNSVKAQRVRYGKVGTELKKREFVLVGGGPVGCLDEFYKHVLCKLKSYDAIVFVDQIEQETITLHINGNVFIDKNNDVHETTTIRKLYGDM